MLTCFSKQLLEIQLTQLKSEFKKALEELAYAHETKARGEYLPYWLEKDEENEEKFLKWYEDNYFSKENKNLMDKTINEYREYQVLTSWQNSSWSDLEEYDDVIED